jgi:hypothetical protein
MGGGGGGAPTNFNNTDEQNLCIALVGNISLSLFLMLL